MSRVRDILRQFYRTDYSAVVIDFDEAVRSILCQSLNLSTMECDRVIGSYIREYWNELRRLGEADQQVGMEAPIRIVDLGGRRFSPSWRALLASERRRERALGYAMKVRPYLLSAIDQLSWREFEGLGAVFMRSLGASRVRVGPGGDEGGVDFCALVPGHFRCHVFGGYPGQMRVIGQCKRFATPISLDRMQVFTSVLDDARRRHEKVMSQLPDWWQRSSGPIVGVFVSYTGFQSGALTRAREHGVMCAADVDVAHAMSLSRILPWHQPATQRASELIRLSKLEVA